MPIILPPPYQMPDPLAGLNQALAQITDTLGQRWQQQAIMKDLTTLGTMMETPGQAQPTSQDLANIQPGGAGPGGGGIPASTAPTSPADILKAMKTPQGAQMAMQMLMGKERTYVYDAQGNVKAVLPGKGQQIKPDEEKAKNAETFISPDGRRAEKFAYGDQIPPGWVPAKQYNDLLKPFKVQEGGNEVWYQRNPQNLNQTLKVGQGPKWDPNKQQMSLETMPDGTTRLVMGSGAAKGGVQTGVQPGTQKDIEQHLLSASQDLSQLQGIRARFNPEYQTFQGQWQGGWLKLKDKAGYQLDPKEQEYLNKFTSYRAESGQMLADVLKRMSGTAVTEPEMKRQEVYLIKAGTGLFDGDSPEQVKAKLDRFEQFQRRAVARLNYVRKSGMSIQNVPLESLDGIMKKQAKTIMEANMKKGIKGDELKNQTQRDLAEMFGLVF